MGTTNRVLSGSLTKGSTASPMTGTIEYTYQGIYANSDKSFFGSLLPRMTFGPQLRLAKVGQPSGSVTFLNKDIFDDTLTVNNDVSDIRDENDDRAQFLTSFDMGVYNFGQAPTVQLGEPFVETDTYTAKKYIQADHDTMWPVNLFNVGSLLDYEYDGIIEPLDIRGEILGTVDTRYEGHAVRGSVSGMFAASTLGNHQLVTSWLPDESSPSPFLDAPETFGLTILSGSRNAQGVWDGKNQQIDYQGPIKKNKWNSWIQNTTNWTFRPGSGDIQPGPGFTGITTPLPLLKSGSSLQDLDREFLRVYNYLRLSPRTSVEGSSPSIVSNAFGEGSWTINFNITFHPSMWTSAGPNLKDEHLLLVLQTDGKRPKIIKRLKLQELFNEVNTNAEWPNNFRNYTVSFEAVGVTHNLRILRTGVRPLATTGRTWLFDFNMYRTISHPNRISGPIAFPGRWAPDQIPDSPFVDTIESKRRNVIIASHNPPTWRPGIYDLSASYGTWHAGTRFVPNDPTGLAGWWKLDDDILATGSFADSSGNYYDALLATGSATIGTIEYEGPQLNDPGVTPSSLIQNNTVFFATGSTDGVEDDLLWVPNPADDGLSFVNSEAKDKAFTVLFRCRPIFHQTNASHYIVDKMNYSGDREYAIRIVTTPGSPKASLIMEVGKSGLSSLAQSNLIFSSSWVPGEVTSSAGDHTGWYSVACVYNGSGSGASNISGWSLFLSGSGQFRQTLPNAYNVIDSGYAGQIANSGMSAGPLSGNLFIGGAGTYGASPAASARSSGFFSGSLCDLSIWDRALSEKEIEAWVYAVSGTFGKERQQSRIVEALEIMGSVDNADANQNTKYATTGFYFGNKAGSITFGDI